ncbi:hypothetical protein [Paenibacillus sp. TH7-28]
MRNFFRIFMVSILFVICGCSTQEKVNLEDSMKAVIEYKQYEVGSEQPDEVKQWLDNVRSTGGEGRYFILQDHDKGEDYVYSYVYRKGSSDYEVSFIYDPSDESNKGKIYVTGINNDPSNEKIVKIKSIKNDISTLFILSDESLNNKLINKF